MENVNRDIAIKITGVKKRYRLGQIGGGSLQADLQSWWAKVRKKEDPNSKIGQEQRLVGQTFMALNGIDLEIYKGEAVGIIGTNGAGKSTLLKLLSRVTAPTEGEIDIYGRIASMLEVGTGFSPEMTGRENVYMNGAILGMTKSEIDAKMEEIIEFSEVRDFIDTPVKRYSSGMYVKLAFSVAAHLDSEIMIMDEVLAVGDMAFQKKCLTKMKEAATKEGRTVLYVSHNMNTIRQLCERCIVLDKGKVVFVGDVEEAIGVYMNNNYQNKTKFDFSNIKRSINEKRNIQMLGIELIGKDKNAYKQKELCEILLCCKCNQTVEDVGFRLEIYYTDGSLVGTVFSDKSVSAEKDQYVDINIKLDTKNFAPGSYKAVALAYEYDHLGQQIGVDRVEPAMFFEIIQDENETLVWNTQYWGHVKFDEMTIEDVIYKT